MTSHCSQGFSGAAAVVLSPNHLTVTQTSNKDAWARREHGFPPGCGAAKWAVNLGDVDGGMVNVLGVVSDAFTEYTRYTGNPIRSWVFQDDSIWADGQRQGDFSIGFFNTGDVVSVELERRPGQDGVMRVRVAGKAPQQDMTGLPRDGMLYPAVCLHNNEQSCTMLLHRRE